MSQMATIKNLGLCGKFFIIVAIRNNNKKLAAQSQIFYCSHLRHYLFCYLYFICYLYYKATGSMSKKSIESQLDEANYLPGLAIDLVIFGFHHNQLKILLLE